MAYIIDTMSIASDLVQFDGPCTGSEIPCATQTWEDTYPTLSEAEAAYDSLQKAAHVLAAALIEWRPRKIDVLPDHLPRTRNFGDRSCVGGIPTQTLLRQGHRSWTRYRYGEPGSMYRPSLYSKTSDWQEQTDQVGLSLTTQPAPGHKLRCPEFGRDGAPI